MITTTTLTTQTKQTTVTQFKICVKAKVSKAS